MYAQIKGDAEAGYTLSGDLTYSTVPRLFSQHPLRCADSTTVDLAQIEHIDSAGLALLVEWTCAARMQNKELILKNVPGSLGSLIKVGGLREVLSLSDR